MSSNYSPFNYNFMNITPRFLALINFNKYKLNGNSCLAASSSEAGRRLRLGTAGEDDRARIASCGKCSISYMRLQEGLLDN